MRLDRFLLLLPALLAAIPTSVRADTALPEHRLSKPGTALFASDSPSGGTAAYPDTSRIYQLGEILITAPSPGVVAAPGRTEVPSSAIEARDGGSAESLAPLVPATRMHVNSRGEVLFALRGASERQIAIFHDSVPLNIPWDERVDLSLVPVEAVGAVHVVRGSGSVLQGPNSLAGVIHLLSRTLHSDGKRTSLNLQVGEGESRRGSLVHMRRRGDWSFMGSASHRSREAFLLPKDFSADRNQNDSRARLNSDLRESSVLLRLSRSLSGRGSIVFSGGGTDARKGVPPEIHRAGEARFWRIPEWRRALLSSYWDFLGGSQRNYRMSGVVSLDLFRQQIQQYPDSSYSAPDQLLDSELETDRDVTGTARLRLSRLGSDNSRISAGFSLRVGNHEESLELNGPVTNYSQVLASAGVEWEGEVADQMLLRAGIGADHSRTPRTGNAPDWGSSTEPVLDLRLSWEPAEKIGLHLKAGRRTRFPSLRELYSGALGKFVPNPSLRSETQDSIELGGGVRSGRVDFAADAFASLLRDGIVKVRHVSGKVQRSNEEEILSLGIELSGHVKLIDGVRADAHHTFLHARAKSGDSYSAHVDGRAEYLSYLSVNASRPIGRSVPGLAKVAIEAVLTGSRRSLDANLGRLTKLPRTAVLNIRSAWSLPRTARRSISGEIYIRVNNLADRIVYSQVGLPEAGRSFMGGLRVEL